MDEQINKMNEKIKALDGINLIQQTWAEIYDRVTDEDRFRYIVMLESAQFYMLQEDFARVNREYQATYLFLLNIQLRGEQAA